MDFRHGRSVACLLYFLDPSPRCVVRPVIRFEGESKKCENLRAKYLPEDYYTIVQFGKQAAGTSPTIETHHIGVNTYLSLRATIISNRFIDVVKAGEFTRPPEMFDSFSTCGRQTYDTSRYSKLRLRLDVAPWFDLHFSYVCGPLYLSRFRHNSAEGQDCDHSPPLTRLWRPSD